jgi:hypothetical protein
VVDEAIVGELVGVRVTLADLFEDLDKSFDGGVSGLAWIREFLSVNSQRKKE